MTTSDFDLLQEYAGQNSEEAFATLVTRHLNLVYSAALRQTRSPQLAEEVSQSVFTDLAQNARKLKPDTILTAWLYQVTRRSAIDVVRRESRRQLREQIATEMNAINATTADWTHIEPMLDEAMHALDETDRSAVLLRYFENKSLREVGATLGTTDDAAQKRVSRAVERLREFFAKRGVTVGASGLVVDLSANAVQAAPVGLVITICSAAFGSMATSGTLTFLKIMTATKLKLGVVSAVIVAGVVIVLFLRRDQNNSVEQSNSPHLSASESASSSAVSPPSGDRESNRFSRSEADAAPVATAQEIVAGKLVQFGRSRREFADALARRHGVEVPDAVKLFFAAVESGNWDEIDARFKLINGGDSSASHGADRPPGVNELWCAIIDAYGVAEQVHEWPAEKLLDYGNAVLGSLRPGMVYVGGTDNGRWIPELLNDTSDGDRYIVVTQNGLADGKYLEYASVLYSDRLVTLTQEDSQRIFQEYITDAQRRLQHDEQFPDEPKQVRPGENLKMQDGHVQVTGMVGVMAINEKLLHALMEKNPDLSFAVQESYPMKGTYADALPLGPLMELRAQNAQNTFTAERAAQSLDYWRTTAQNVLADPEATGSAAALKSYSHDATSTANLLAAHNYTAEAEQAYRLSSQLWPGNPEPVGGLAVILARTGRAAEARQMLDNFASNYPDQRPAIETFEGSILWTAPSAKPSP